MKFFCGGLLAVTQWGNWTVENEKYLITVATSFIALDLDG
jgi:hypothetical protein